MQQVLLVPEVHCDNCKTSLEGAVSSLVGVEKVEVVISDAALTVSYDESQVGLDRIKEAVEEQGYAVFG